MAQRATRRTALDARVEGDVLTPTRDGYDAARAVWNGVIDRRPALIVRPVSADDVAEAIIFGREQGLEIAIRGGGHNVAGTAVCDGGLVIDLSRMNEVRVDPDAHRATGGGGATWAELDAATQEHGLAAPGGVVSDTGIAGLTLGGGIGWLRRKYGLSCDNLVSCEVVTASGELLRASADENPDLFWALRGSGGGIGVVTSFTYRLHPVGPEVAVALAFHPGERASDVLGAYRALCEEAPDEVTSFAICGTVPDAETFPEEIHGRAFVLLAACYAGDPMEGEQALRAFREVDEPLVDLSGRLPYVEVQQAFDEDYPQGMRYYWKSLYLDELTPDAIDRIITETAKRPSPLSTVDVWHLGGAISRVGDDETAFAPRGAPYLLGVEANWEDPAADDDNVAWARGCVEALRPHSSGAGYVNFPGFYEEGDTGMRTTYGANFERLARIRETYDPEGVFRAS